MTGTKTRVFKHRRTEVLYTFIGTAKQEFAKKPTRKFVIYKLADDEEWRVMKMDYFFNGDLVEVI
jgi:hypothetical protein